MGKKIEQSAELKALISAFHKEKATRESRTEKSTQQALDAQTALEQARRDLDAAMDATLAKSNEANLTKEREARRKVAELELDVKGADARKSRSFSTSSGNTSAIANEVAEFASKEARAVHDANIDAVMKKVEDAKYAYLTSLVDYKRFSDEVNAVYYDSIREVGKESAMNESPSVKPLNPFRSGGYDNFHGVLDTEINAAYKHGTIGRFSVREGRVIN